MTFMSLMSKGQGIVLEPIKRLQNPFGWEPNTLKH